MGTRLEVFQNGTKTYGFVKIKNVALKKRLCRFQLLSKMPRPTPSDPELYATIKRAAKQKFTVWPSLYASAWLVKQYKDAGGKFDGEHKSDRLKKNIKSNNCVDTRFWPSRAEVQAPITPAQKTFPVSRAK